MSTIIVFVLRFPSKRRFVKEIVAYQILFCVATLEAGFINHADGGNEKIKNSIFNTHENKNSKRAGYFFADFFVVFARLIVSNLIVMAIWSSL